MLEFIFPLVFLAVFDVFNNSVCLFVVSYFCEQNSSETLRFRRMRNALYSRIYACLSLIICDFISCSLFTFLIPVFLFLAFVTSPASHFLLQNSRCRHLQDKTISVLDKQPWKIPCHSLGVFLVRIEIIGYLYISSYSVAVYIRKNSTYTYANFYNMDHK